MTTPDRRNNNADARRSKRYSAREVHPLFRVFGEEPTVG